MLYGSFTFYGLKRKMRYFHWQLIMTTKRTKSELVSVIVPTLNAAQSLPLLLAKLKQQTLAPFEFIVIDSASDDDTVKIAESQNCKVIEISQEKFDHSGTRTLAAQHALGEILVFLTQDVLLFDEFSIEKLVEPLLKDPEVGAVFGRQIPYFDASIFAEHLRIFNYPDSSCQRSLDDREKYGLKTVFFSDSFSTYRKTALEKIGYFRDGLIFGEDTCAAADMLLKSMKIVYAADAKVFHSHNYSISQEFRRYFDMGVFHCNESWLLDKFGKAEGQGIKYVKSELAFLTRKRRFDLLPELVLRIFAKYLGYKLGRWHKYLPLAINKRFSMNFRWWDRFCSRK